MKKVVVFVTGLPGSGKSVFTDVAISRGIPVVVLGDIVREEVSRRGLEPSLENLIKIAQELRERLGPEAIAMLSVEKLLKILDMSCLVVIDGVRSLKEVEYIKMKTDAEAIIVAIHASPKTRFNRLKMRSRSDDPREWSEFIERDMRELSWGLGNVIALADVVIVNEGSLDEFKAMVKEFLDKVVREWCT
ncbi:MAG: AAA family ATPase [Ignisphaera sp.]